MGENPETVVTASDRPRPRWGSRLLAAGCYLGLAPLLAVFRARREDGYVQHHVAQALVLLGGLPAIAFFSLAVYLGEILYWYGAHDRPSWVQGDAFYKRFYVAAEIGAGLYFLVWALLLVAGLVLAVIGSVRGIPLVRRLARSGRVQRASLIGCGLLLAGVLLLAAITWHAASLTRSDDAPAKVYMLYDDGIGGIVPRWVFALGMYRISLEAEKRWGPGQVVVAPLTEDRLRQALGHGRFVFLGAHGTSGFVTAGDVYIRPPPLKNRHYVQISHGGTRSPEFYLRTFEPGGRQSLYLFDLSPSEMKCKEVMVNSENLRFVYVSACGGSHLRAEWEGALAPAEVKTFPDYSWVDQHVSWLWLRAPARLREIE